MNEYIAVLFRVEDGSVGSVVQVQTKHDQSRFERDFEQARQTAATANDDWTVDDVLDALRIQGYQIQSQGNSFASVYY